MAKKRTDPTPPPATPTTTHNDTVVVGGVPVETKPIGQSTAEERADAEARVNQVVERIDRWVNWQTGIGTFEDKTRAGYFAPPIRLTDAEITALASANDLAAKAIEKRPREMFRRGYVIEPEGGEDDGLDKTDIEEVRKFANEQLQLDIRMRQGMVFGRQYGGSILILGINDGGEPWEPVNEDRIQSVDFINQIDRRFAYVQSYYSDYMTPRYGDPETYLVANAVATSTYRNTDQQYRMKKRVSLPKGQNYASSGGYSILNVHESRIIRFDGIEPDVLTRQQLAGWSWSILQRAYEILRLCDMAFDSLAYLISDASQGVMKLKGLLKGLSVPGQRQAIEQRMKLIDESRSVLRSIALDPDGNEDFTRVVTPLTGIPDAVDRLMQRLAAAFDMPVTELFGISPAGLNATGESDRNHWYDTIATDQENDLAPKLKRVYRLLALAKRGPLKGKDINWRIKFNPLHSPTEDDIASTRLKNAQRDQIYLETAAVTPEEVAVTLQDVYPHLNVEEREEQIKAGKQFQPYPNEPPPDPTGGAGTSGGIGEGQSPTVPLPGSSIRPGGASPGPGTSGAPAGEGQGTPGDGGTGNPKLGQAAKQVGKPKLATRNAAQTDDDEKKKQQQAAAAKKDADDAAVARTLVRAQLEDDFPPEVRTWIERVPWSGPTHVPLAKIDFNDKPNWKAFREPEVVDQFRRNITRGIEKPILLVHYPNASLYKIADGHHHSLAYEQLGQAPLAFIAEVPAEDGPWNTMEQHQLEGAAPQTAHGLGENVRVDGQPHIVLHRQSDGLKATWHPSRKAAAAYAKSLTNAGADAEVLTSERYKEYQRKGWDPDDPRRAERHVASGRFQKRGTDPQMHLPIAKADAIPVREQPADFGTVVPAGGSHCANCKYLASAEPALCGNETFAQWVQYREGMGSGNPPAPIPAPGGDVDRFCCSAWEADVNLVSRESKTDFGADHAEGPALTPVPSPESAQLPEASIGILRNGNTVLGVRAAEGWRGHSWTLPGGTANPNETPEMTLRRELAEEVGIVCIDVEHAIDVVSPTDGRLVHVFHVRTWTGTLRPDFLEIQRLRWLMPVQLLHASGPWRKTIQELRVKGILGGKAETETGPFAQTARLLEAAAQGSDLNPTDLAPENSKQSDDNPTFAEYGRTPTRMDAADWRYDGSGWDLDDATALKRVDAMTSARSDGDIAKDVFNQLLADYEAKHLGWVLAVHWEGPTEVPLDELDMRDRSSWTASRDGKVGRHVEQIEAGKSPPVILVRPKKV